MGDAALTSIMDIGSGGARPLQSLALVFAADFRQQYVAPFLGVKSIPWPISRNIPTEVR